MWHHVTESFTVRAGATLPMVRHTVDGIIKWHNYKFNPSPPSPGFQEQAKYMWTKLISITGLQR
jgi:hypothetical protein